MKNKTVILTTSIILQAGLLSACTSENWIDNVKSGVFSSYDKVKPVGVVYDNWKSCKSVFWEVVKEEKGYAEVKFTCDIKGIDNIVSALKDNQNSIEDSNKLKYRKLEKEKEDYLSRSQLDVCKTEFFIEKISKGITYRSKDSLLTGDELNSLVNEYHEILLDSFNKAKSNEIYNEEVIAKIKKDTKYLSEINEKLKYKFSNSGSVLFQGNAEKLSDNKNEKYKEIQSNLLECIGDNSNYYIGDERVIGDYRNINYYLKKQQDIALLKKQKNFDSLKGIKVTVLFDVNKDNFNISNSYSEFVIGDEIQTTSYSKNIIQSLIYKDVNLSEEFIKGNVIDYLANKF
ncbi:hypothetical protein MT391_20430 [Vibrio sp. 1-Bac 57]